MAVVFHYRRLSILTSLKFGKGLKHFKFFHYVIKVPVKSHMGVLLGKSLQSSSPALKKASTGIFYHWKQITNQPNFGSLPFKSIC